MKRVAIALVATTTAATIGFIAHHARRSDERRSVAAALAREPRRFMEARLVGLPHAPATRPADAARESAEVLGTATAALANDERPLSLESRHERAIAHLVLHKPAAAVSILEELVTLAPRNAVYWNDLAAARHEESRETADALTLAKSLAAADEAIRLNPRLPAAHFNRALALARLGLRPLATAAASTLTTIEPRSAWTEEAQRAIGITMPKSRRARWQSALPATEQAARSADTAALKRAVSEFPTEARAWSESLYLAGWADAFLNGHAREADDALTIASALAATLREVNGEQLPADAVARIEEAVSRTDRQAVRALANAHATYTRARLLVQARRVTEAEAELLEAEKAFRSAGSPMELIAACYRIGALIDRHQFDQAEKLAARLVVPQRYVATSARIALEQSRLYARTARTHDALMAANRAAALSDRIGDTDEATRARTNATSLLTYVGRPRDAWAMRQRMFADASASSNPALLEMVLNAAAGDAIAERHFDVARTFYDLEIGFAAASPIYRFDALLWRTYVASRMAGAGGLQADDLAALRNAAAVLPDPALRADAEDKIRMGEAMSLRDTQPLRAAALLTETIRHREKHGATLLAEALIERGRAYRSAGAIAESMTDLSAALERFTRDSTGIGDTALRDAFFGTGSAACRELAELQLGAGQAVRSFLTVDRCRALHFGRNEHQSLVDRLQTRVGTTSVLLEFHVTDHGTTIFALNRDGLHVLTSPVNRDRIEERLDALRSAWATNQEERAATVLKNLSSEILGPTWPLLRAVETIVVVPDETTSQIPFAGLPHLDTSRHLVDSHRILMFPDAYTYAAAARRPSTALRSAIVVGDPSFDPERFAQLERLVSARQEAEQVAQLYANSVLLTGANATPARFLTSAPSKDLIHIAAHAILSREDPWTSTLVLAADSHDAGVVYLHEIAKLELARAPLVVLAGCRTASQGTGGGSLRSFAAAFLAAGSRGVIATTEQVDDVATREFSLQFHRRLRDGVAPADALRASQLAMLHSKVPAFRHPRAWAAFQYYGSN